MKQTPCKNYRLIKTLLLLAMFMQSLMPLGFMPAKAADGSVDIVICDGLTQITRSFDIQDTPYGLFMDDEAPEHHQDQTDSMSCPFALSSSAFDLPNAHILPAPIYEQAPMMEMIAHQTRLIQTKSFQSQAPPVSA
jgi:hypothetical protein